MLFAPLLIAAPAWAAPAPQEEAGVTDILLVYCAGAEALFADPKDQALLRALRLVDDRVGELPGEIPDFPHEAAALMPLISRIVGGPMTLRVGAWQNADPTMGPPVFAQLTLPEPSPEAARVLVDELTRILVGTGMPTPETDEAGNVILPAPIPAWYGVEGDRFRMTVGIADEGEVVPGATGLPEGVEAVMAMSLEYGAMMDMAASMAAMSGDPSMGEALDMLDRLGLLDLSLQVAYGVGDELGYTVMSLPGYAGFLRGRGLEPARTLEPKDISRIPADAVWASFGTMNAGGTFDMYMTILEDVLAQQGMTGDPLEMVAQQMGFHPRADLIDHLGSSWGLYASDTTGGGGFVSTVAFMEVKDTEALAGTLDQVKDMLNAIAGMQAMGYVQARDWVEEGVRYTSLVFPGLPAPFELTYAMDGGYLYAGLNPQAVTSAIVHAQQGGAGLLSNGRFTENLAGGLEGLLSASYMDTPRLVRDGYGLALLLGTALRNATRSPHDPTRDAGQVVPPYPVLVSGAKASVTASRWIGDDVVSETRGDRSMVVGLAGAAGALASAPILPLVALAAVGAAEEFKSRSASAPFVYEIDGDEPYEIDDDY